MNKQQFTAELRINAIVTEAQRELQAFSNSLGQTWKNGEPPKNVMRAYEELRNRLASLQELSKKGVVNSAELSQAEQDYKAFQKNIHSLSVEFKLFTTEQKKAMLSKEEQNAMSARAKAVDDYTEALRRNREIQEKREGLEKKKSGKQATLATLTSTQTTKKQELAGLQALEDPPTDKINALKVEIKQLGKDITDTSNAIREIDISLDSLSEMDADKAFQKLKSSLKEAGVEGADTATSLKDLQDMIDDLDAKAIENVNQNLENLGNELEGLKAKGLDAKAGIDETTESLQRQSKAAAERSAFEEKIKQFLGLKGAAILLRKSLQEAFNTIKELDAAMTAMAVVTDTDISGYWDQLPQYTARANEMGLAIKDVYEADTLFYQQGLETQEVVALSTETMKMARVAGLQTAEATDRMTAALRGFNMELNAVNAQNVADVYSKLAAITASDVDEISSAMTKTASIAASAGMEFETTAAFLSQIIETTRESAETAGTAMKTVIARFQELKKSPNEIGEIDGEIVDANKIETALRSVGVSLRDANGQFRELDDVFLELSSKWDSLDTNTQRYIATIAAGSRQQSRFIAMMSDYGRTQELVTAANNSAGASNEQFGKTMESLDAKLNKLANAWKSFTMGIIESDFVKALVTGLTKLITTLDKATKGFGKFSGVISKLGLIFAVFKAGQVIYNKFAAGIIEKTRQIGREAAKGFKEEFNKGLEEGEKVPPEKSKKEVPKTEGEKPSESKEKKASFLASMFPALTQAGQTRKRVAEGQEKLTAAEAKKQGAEQSLEAAQNEVTVNKQKQEEALANLEMVYTNRMTGIGLTIEETKQSWEEFSASLATGPIDADKALGDMENKFQEAIVSVNTGRKEKAEEEIEEYSGKGELKKTQKEAKKAQEAIDTAEDKSKANDYETDAINEFISANEDLMGSLMDVASAEEDKAKADEEIAEAQGDIDNALSESSSKLNQWSEGLSIASGVATGLGMGMAFLSTQLEEAGFEEAAETTQVLSSVLTVLGVVLGFIPPIFTLIGNEGAKAWLKVLGPIALIIAGVVALIAIISILVSVAKNNSLEGRMEAAAEATQEATKAAQEAKKAYDDLLEDRSGYDETQKALKDLTYGTKEWKDTLIEANQQVLDLITKYPELAQYMEKGTEGQLTISDEGWEKMQEKQLSVVRNTQGLQMNRQLDELELKKEAAQDRFDESDYKDLTYKYTYSVDEQGNITDTSSQTSAKIREQLEEIYAGAEEGAEGFDEKLQKLADDYDMPIDKLKEAGVEITKREEEMRAIAKQAEAVAKANLTAMTSQSLQDSGFADEVTDIFASAQVKLDEDTKQAQVDARTKALKEGKDYKDSGEFKKIADQYGVELTGNDTADLKKVYKAATGATDEDLEGMSRDQMIEALAKVSINDEMTKAMDELGERLVNVQGKYGAETAKAIAGALSSGGTGLTQQTAENLLSNGELNTEAVEKMAEQLGYGTAQNWADAMNMSLEDFYDSIEDNAKDASKGYKKITARLQSVGIEVAGIAEGVGLTLQQTEQLAEKLMGVANASGVEVAKNMEDQVESALATLPASQRDVIANMLGTMNWHDAASWDELEILLKDLGQSANPVFASFIQEAKKASNALATVNLDELTNGIVEMYDTLQKIQHGSTREFSEEEANAMIKNNEPLKKDFIQIGDKFVYIGQSLDSLEEAIIKQTLSNQKMATAQLEASKIFGQAAQKALGEEEDAKTYYTDLSASNESIDVKKGAIIDFFQEATANYEAGGKDILSLMTDENGASLGLSAASINDGVIAGWSEEFTNKVLNSIGKSAQTATSEEEYQAKLKQDRISTAAMVNDYSVNLANAQKYRGTGEGEESARALHAQAAASGVVAEAVLSAYSAAIESGDTAKMTELEATIDKSMKTVIKNQEGQKAIADFTNRTFAALEQKEQEQIDAMQAVVDATEESTQQMLDKMQEQIDDQRKARQEEKQLENLNNMEQKLAYLQASGGSQLEIKAMEEELAQAREDYQNTLIDNQMNRLNDAAAKAAEQRQLQITLAQQSLDWSKQNGTLMLQAQKIVTDSLTAINSGVAPLDTTMGTLLKGTEAKNISDAEVESWSGEFNSSTVAAANAITENADDNKVDITPIENNVEGVPDITKDVAELLKKKLETEDENSTTREEQIQKAAKIVASNGWAAAKSDKTQAGKDYAAAKAEYVKAGGTAEDFESRVKGNIQDSGEEVAKTGVLGTGTYSHLDAAGDHYGHEKGELQGIWYSYIDSADSTTQTELNAMFGETDQKIVLYKGIPYIYSTKRGHWGNWTVKKTGWKKISMGKNELAALTPYETGGLADFTGPAWLDGTKSRPELVLNQTDTQNFIALKDILSDIMSHNIGSVNNTKSGDNYFDIEINVESLENDYDVEQVADKIRDMIYRDATARNVNALSQK